MIDAEKALVTLARNNVEFVIVGGVAAALHGSAYATYDLDLCYSHEAANLERLAEALAPYRPRLRDLPAELPFLWDRATLRNRFNFTLRTGLNDIDLLAEIAGVGGFEQVKAAAVAVPLFGREILVLSLLALIAAKRAAGREKDLRALPELEALAEAAAEGTVDGEKSEA